MCSDIPILVNICKNCVKKSHTSHIFAAEPSDFITYLILYKDPKSVNHCNDTIPYKSF